MPTGALGAPLASSRAACVLRNADCRRNASEQRTVGTTGTGQLLKHAWRAGLAAPRYQDKPAQGCAEPIQRMGEVRPSERSPSAKIAQKPSDQIYFIA